MLQVMTDLILYKETMSSLEEQNNRLEQIYGKHLKLIVCTGKRSEKVKFKHED